MKFSERLAGLRKKTNMTQAQMAESINVSIDSVRRWEAGKQEPRLAQLMDLASLFKLSIDQLLNDDDKESELIKIESKPKTIKIKTKETIILRTDNATIELPPTPESYEFLERQLEGLLSATEWIVLIARAVAKKRWRL